MVMSREALKAKHRAKGVRVFRGFAPWELDWDKGAVRRTRARDESVTRQSSQLDCSKSTDNLLNHRYYT